MAINKLMKNKGVCRTAPATPGLLKKNFGANMTRNMADQSTHTVIRSKS